MIAEYELIQVSQAVDAMACLRGFPSQHYEPEGRLEIMRLTERMANSFPEVALLSRTMIDQVGYWPGPVEYRGVYCQLGFSPADGVRAKCTVLNASAPAYHLLAPVIGKRYPKEPPLTEEEKAWIAGLQATLHQRAEKLRIKTQLTGVVPKYLA